MIPDTVEALTPGWLTDALLGRGVIAQGTRVVTVTAEPLVARAGVNGQTFRLRLTYDGAPGPASMVAKLPAGHAAARGVAVFQRWYEREARYYLELATDTPIRTPAAYLARFEGARSLLLLEDLGGMRFADSLEGVALADVEAAVDALAAMHAAWWGRIDAAKWLPVTTVNLDHAGPVQGAFARAWDTRRELASDGVRATIDRAVEAYPALLQRIGSGPRTLLHGDFRFDNLCFDAVVGDHAVLAYDWQFACRGRGTYDLAYLLGLDLDPTVRREHEEALLRRYVGGLRTGGVEGYGLDEARRDYATSLLLGFAVFTIGAAGPSTSERMDRVHRTGLARLGAAIEDQDASLLP